MHTEIEDVLLDNLDDFGTGSASFDDTTKKPGDKSNTDDADDLSKKIADDEEEEEPDNSKNTDDDEDPLDIDLDDDEDDDESPNKSSSTTKSKSKEATIGVFNSLIKKGILKPFVDDNGKEEDISKYTSKDLEDLLQANIETIEEKTQAELQASFFDEMPEEFRIAYAYMKKGGTDIKSLFKLFAENSEFAEMDPNVEDDSETLARTYLKLTGFGTDAEIDEQIEEWKDLNPLNKKAENFKPKIQKVKQDMVNQKLAQQEADRQKRIAAVQNYQSSVVDALKAGELNGVKIDRKTQSRLYSGLVNLEFDSLTGRKVNKLGHLLEKYQFVEPKLDLVSEVLWLLEDPEGYKEKIRNQGEKKATAETVRKLKTEEGKSTPTVVIDDDREEKSRNKNKKFTPRSIFG
jgi:hypothetical protein